MDRTTRLEAHATLLIQERFQGNESCGVWFSLYQKDGTQIDKKRVLASGIASQIIDHVGKAKWPRNLNLLVEEVDPQTLHLAVGAEFSKRRELNLKELRKLPDAESRAAKIDEWRAQLDANPSKFGTNRVYTAGEGGCGWKFPAGALLLIAAAGLCYLKRHAIQAWLKG